MPQKTSWEKMEREQLSPTLARKAMTGANLTVAQLLIDRGTIVPRHSHVSEQFTYVVRGALKLTFDDGEAVLRAGDVLVIPGEKPHAAEALEDCLVMDLFSPRRDDWLRKDDAYLREGGSKK